MQQLSLLPKATPPARFADRVMARVVVASDSEHLSLEDLDLWVTGALPSARESHLRSCPDCQRLANEERLLVLRLEALPLFDPRAGFDNRVMDRVNIPVSSLAGAWRLWRTRFSHNPASVGIAASVAVLLGGSLAASGAWAAGNQDTITGAGTWLMNGAEGLYWQWLGTATTYLEAQSWYPAVRAALTPTRLVLLLGATTALYAAGVMALKRLMSLPASQVARAAS